ncbi:MAG: amidohydrolase family protein [Steroidobacteraceae bacterium]
MANPADAAQQRTLVLSHRTRSFRAPQHLKVGLSIALAVFSSLAAAQAQVPDLVLYNGKISTMTAAANPTVQAVAIQGGKVLATGTTAQIRKLAGRSTRSIDLMGKRVLPGLIDGHLHGVRTAYHCWTQTVRIDQVTSRASALDAYRAKADQIEDGRWIFTTGGWSLKQLDDPRDFSFAELTAAAPNNPVWIAGANVAGPRINSASLAALGLKAGDAGVELDAQGQPTGRLTAPATERANQAILAQLDTHGIDGEATCLADFISDAVSHGMTAWADAGGNTNPWSNKGAITDGLHSQEAASWLHRTGKLKVRIALHDMSGFRGAASATQNMENSLGFLGDDRLRVLGPGEDTFAEDPDFLAYVRTAAIRRLSLETHVNPTNHDQILAGFEAANQVYPLAGLGWRIAHPEGGTPTDLQLQRAKAVGAGYILTFTPLWRGGAAQRFRSTRDAGLRLCLGSDAMNVAPWQPFQNLWMATTGNVLAQGAPGVPANERLDRFTALQLVTSDCAWSLGLEDKIGSLAPGKYADLIVLDGDYFEVPPEQIRKITPELTMVQGEIVYARAPFKP